MTKSTGNYLIYSPPPKKNIVFWGKMRIFFIQYCDSKNNIYMLNKPKIYIFKIIIQSYFKSIMQTLLQYMYSTCLNESHIKKKETFQRVRYAIIMTNWKGNMLRKWSVFCGSPCTGNRHSLITRYRTAVHSFWLQNWNVYNIPWSGSIYMCI